MSAAKIGAQQLASAQMLFCCRCNNLLYPESNSERRMVWRCLNCANEEEHDEYPVAYVINMQRQKGSQREQELLGEFAADPTAGRGKDGKKNCVKCNNDDVACFVNPLEQPTDDMSLYFACARCKHVWS